jgi:hypothetical protein
MSETDRIKLNHQSPRLPSFRDKLLASLLMSHTLPCDPTCAFSNPRSNTNHMSPVRTKTRAKSLGVHKHITSLISL